MFEGNQGFDERELRALVYKTSRGEDRYILVRNAGTNTIGRMETYRIDMNTCLPISKSETTDFHAQSHEFFLWHDPANPNRVLVYMAIWTAGLPDPEHPGLEDPRHDRAGRHRREHRRDAAEAEVLAGFSLQEVGGPPLNERPDATGLFADGRFLDFSDLKNRSGRGRKLSEPAAEQASLAVGHRRRRAGLRGGHDRRVLRARLRGDRASHGRGAGRRHGGMQSALDDRVGRRRHRCGRSCRRSPTTACTWS